MSGYALSPLAQADIRDIWDYTKTNWGEKQAVLYIQDIRDACRALADGTRMGRPVSVRKGYRKYIVGSHVLYYKTSGSNDIVIVRILHTKMDVDRHL